MAQDDDIRILQSLIDALKTESRTNSVSPLRLASIHQHLLDLIKAFSSEAFLRKDSPDRTPFPLNVGGTLTAEDWLLVGKYIQGISGAGISPRGNAELESLTVRSYLRVYELIVNRQRTFDSDLILSEGDKVESLEYIGPSSEGRPRYTLRLHPEWEGYTTALYEGDVLRGIYNDITASQSPEGEYGTRTANGALVFTVWMRVLAVRPLDNEIDVVLYPDSDTPAGRNFLPRPCLAISRWGNAGETEAQKKRQRVLYLSSSEGCIALLDHVTKPIIDKGNIVFLQGRLPGWISDFDMDFREGDSGAYIRNLYVERIQEISHAAIPDPVITYRGDYHPAATYYDGTVKGPVDPTGETGPTVPWEKSQVGYTGCQWICNRSGTANAPTWDSLDWSLYIGDPRLHLEFDSPDSVVDIDNPDITLAVIATVNFQDITSHPAMRYDWSRRSVLSGIEDTSSDTAWTALHQNAGPSLRIQREDMNYAFGHPPDELVYTVLATLDPTSPSPPTDSIEITI